MKVILLKNIEELGYKNDIITVKNGYANNYLIPQSLVKVANKANIKQVQEIVKQTAFKEDKHKKKALHLVEVLAVTDVVVDVKADKTGKTFGAVTSTKISEVLKAKGYDVAPEQIALSRPIKELGSHEIQLTLYKEVNMALTIQVTSTAEA